MSAENILCLSVFPTMNRPFQRFGLSMFYGISRAVLTACFVMISLYLWRGAYAFGDWAVIALLPLAVALFVAHRELVLDMHLARRRVMWREDTWAMRWLRGRLSSSFWALVFVVVTVPLLAWQAVAIKAERLPQLALAFLLASLLFTFLQGVVGRYLQAPFHRNAAMNLAVLAMLPLVVYAAWQSYRIDTIPHELLNARLSEVPLVALDSLPRKDGWLSQLMAPMQIYDSGKLWIAGQFPKARWLHVLISLDAALFGFLMARAAVVVTDFLQMHCIATRK